MEPQRWNRWLARCWPPALFILLTLVLTWPHVRDIDFALPGTEEGSVHQDPLFNVWTLAQAVRNVKGHGDGLFESNAFWPRRLTLCYSDHLLGWLPLSLPLSLLTDDFVLIFNILFLLTFVLSALGAYLLVKDLTGSPVAGALGGVVFAFCPFRMTQYGHFAGESLHWLPFALFCAHRSLQGRDWRYAAGAVFFVFLQTVTSGVYGIYFCVYLGFLLLLRSALRKGVSAPGVSILLAAGAVLFLLLLPFYWPNITLRQEMGFVQTGRENVRVAADVLTVFGVPEHSIYQWVVGGRLPPGEGMFPGLLVLALAGYGFSRYWRKGGDEREIALLHLSGAVFAWALSLGPSIKFNTTPLCPGPYALLTLVCPWIQVLRMSTRFGALMMLSLAVLAGLGLSEWLASRSRHPGRHTVGIFLILLVEYASVPRPLGAAPDAAGVPPVYQWLRTRPGDPVLVEIPYTHGYADAFWMFYSLHHGKRIVNGYSAYTPPEGKIAVMALVDFPSDASIEFLKATGADWVVVHRDILPATVPEEFAGLRRLAEFGSEAVYEIRKQSPARRPAALLPLSSSQFRLSSETEPSTAAGLACLPWLSWPSGGFAGPAPELRIGFPEPAHVRRVELDFDPLADLSPARFRIRASEDGETWEDLTPLHLLPAFYLSARSSPRCPVLPLELPERSYRRLAIRPDLATGACSWPLKGIRILVSGERE